MPPITVQITGFTAEEVYVSLVDADQYIAGMIGKGAAAYRALIAANDADSRNRLIIATTRYIDQHGWQGDAELAAYAAYATTLQFPRTGLTIKGTPTIEADQLALVRKATCELIAYFAAKQSAATDADTGQNVRTLGAGSARIEFFSPTSLERGTATKLPTVAQALIGMWLGTGGGAVLLSTGGSSTPGECSNFDPNTESKRFEPL